MKPTGLLLVLLALFMAAALIGQRAEIVQLRAALEAKP